ncbi:unnamed protein product [Amoebophrya sp. A120]|nr:unnamed protein product [Amoebophrya sp. A120]|eukprot:GSA120T00024688001.1
MLAAALAVGGGGGCGFWLILLLILGLLMMAGSATIAVTVYGCGKQCLCFYPPEAEKEELQVNRIGKQVSKRTIRVNEESRAGYDNVFAAGGEIPRVVIMDQGGANQSLNPRNRAAPSTVSGPPPGAKGGAQRWLSYDQRMTIPMPSGVTSALTSAATTRTSVESSQLGDRDSNFTVDSTFYSPIGVPVADPAHRGPALSAESSTTSNEEYGNESSALLSSGSSTSSFKGTGTKKGKNQFSFGRRYNKNKMRSQVDKALLSSSMNSSAAQGQSFGRDKLLSSSSTSTSGNEAVSSGKSRDRLLLSSDTHHLHGHSSYSRDRLLMGTSSGMQNQNAQQAQPWESYYTGNQS